MGGFSPVETTMLEGLGLASETDSNSTGVRVIIAVQEDGTNNTVLAAATTSARLVVRRRHVNGLSSYSGYAREGGTLVTVVGSCLGTDVIEPKAHIEPFGEVSMTGTHRDMRVIDVLPGIGNASSVRFAWRDSTAGDGRFNFMISSASSEDAGTASCSVSAGFQCLEAPLLSLPVSYAPPTLGNAIPSIGLN